MYATGYDQYRTQAATTASPAQLVMMLYDGVLSEVARAERALAADAVDHAEVNDCLSRAQAIVTELAATLDHERGGVIAANLASLYSYCNEQLVEANIRKSADTLPAVTSTIAGIREAWETACVNSAVGDRQPVTVAG